MLNFFKSRSYPENIPRGIVNKIIVDAVYKKNKIPERVNSGLPFFSPSKIGFFNPKISSLIENSNPLGTHGYTHATIVKIIILLATSKVQFHDIPRTYSRKYDNEISNLRFPQISSS